MTNERLCRLVLAMSIAAAPAAAEASGFVYVAVPAAPCSAPSPCASPQLHIYDADTAALVIQLSLPVHTTPVGIAMSPDGSRLYVSNLAAEFDGVTSLTIVDARRHAILATHPTGSGIAGKLAVRGDNSRVFILNVITAFSNGDRLSAFDTASNSVTQTIDVVGRSIAASAPLDRVFVLGFGPACCNGSTGRVYAFDGGTLAAAGQVDLVSQRGPIGMSLSPDGQRLHVIVGNVVFWHTIPFDHMHIVLDPALLTMLSSRRTVLARGDPVEFTAGRELLAVGSTLGGVIAPPGVLFRLALDSDASRSVQVAGRALAATLPPGDARAYMTTTASSSGGIDALHAIDLAANSVVTTTPLRAASSVLTATPPGVQACSYRADSAFVSVPHTGGARQLRLTTGCDWQASSSASWVRMSTTQGSGTATIDVTVDPNVLPTSRTATLTVGGQVVTVTQAGMVSQPPFGVVDTPVNGALGISGSLAVTGWALDDVGVSRVRIFRDPVAGEGPALIYLGDATFVEGARPDVQAVFPTAPFANRAGWGLMVLTNMLPNGGNGTYRVWAFADDVEGQTALVGGATFTASNAGSVLPFGALDTPGQGETVSGMILNWGWALTPSPLGIPTDGSTIDVLIDGVVVGHPTYGLFRGDIAALFPGYANTNSAVGYYVLDTRTLTNGVHSIAWVVRDSAGNVEGIGSRFFTVFNP